MKLREWAELEGLEIQTVQRWCNTGKLPVPCEKIGRLWIIHDPKYETNNIRSANKRKTVCYARVSSGDQKKDLERQLDRLKAFSISMGEENPVMIKEIASGMNENRKQLNKILSDPSYETIIVEHRDRLARLNSNLINSALKAQGRRIIVIDDSEVEDDLVRDITEVMTSFCARFYGKRGARNRAARAMKAAEECTDQ